MELSKSKEIVVACVGTSTVASKGTFKWINELEKRPQNSKFHFYNFGIGGDLAYNVLQRSPTVIALNPDIVLLLVGADDILSSVFKNVRSFFGITKHLPKDPSAEWFQENLVKIVDELKEKTSAKIALISPQQLGENSNSQNPIQKKLNLLSKEYADIIRNVATTKKIDYIPFYEQLHKEIGALPGKSFVNFSFLAFYRDYVFREFILRRSFDEIAKENGWEFHIDGVHLNSRGGLILTNTVQEFLDNVK